QGVQVSVSLPQESLGLLKYALFAISLLSLVMAHLLRKLFLQSKGAADQTRQPDAATHPAAAKYTTALILSAALSESVAIYGLIMFFIARDIVTFCILLAVSAVAMLFFRPRKTELFKLAERMRT
ncbi:hypothetical protein, partial [Candidatus Electronema sp. TJ]|uniref:hypothetical protein n=1 Tax=Candidatus Electronema sp. TJ TaxID=3401573 RepID=UPI003AA82E98